MKYNDTVTLKNPTKDERRQDPTKRESPDSPRFAVIICDLTDGGNELEGYDCPGGCQEGWTHGRKPWESIG